MFQSSGYPKISCNNFWNSAWNSALDCFESFV